MHIGLLWRVTLFNASSFLLIAEHSNNSLWCWHLHTQELLPYDSIELVHESSAENREIWIVHVDHIESECFGSGIVKVSKGYMQSYFSYSLDWFPSEAQQWVLSVF
jgi:hypothetical protein